MRLEDRLRLASILGRRAFGGFALITFLVVALLAATNLTSRFALKTYTERQLARVPWDVTVYQLTDIPNAPLVPGELRRMPEVERVEALHFLRTTLPEGVSAEVDGTPVRTPWVSLLLATDPQLLPPEARAVESTRGILALMGPERDMGEAFKALQGARDFALVASRVGEHPHAAGEPPRAKDAERVTILRLGFDRVVRLEREELNRHFMDRTGAIAFIPSIGLVLTAPYDDRLVARFDELSRGALEDAHELDVHVQAGGYIPESVHMLRSHRNLLVSGWDLDRSKRNMEILVGRVRSQLSGVAEQLYVSSDSLVLLDRMIAVARVLGVLTLLIALPLLWMAWVLAGNFVALLMLNERRTMGLMRLRGVSGAHMGQTFLAVIAAGGALGGLLGMAAGTALPSLLYEGRILPWDLLLEVQKPALMALFLCVGIAFALLVSRRLVAYATTISPREAASRLASSEAAQLTVRFRAPQLAALLIGAYRLASWITGVSLGGLTRLGPLAAFESLLDFAALPLFTYGLATLLVSRQRPLRRMLGGMTALLGGRLRDFTLTHTAAKPHRVASVLFVVALVAGVSLYPLIAAGSFEEKALRGTRVQTGTELNLTFNAPELAQRDLNGGMREQVALLREPLMEIARRASAVEGVESVSYLYEALLPNFYLPGRGFTGIPLYLVDDPGAYLDSVYTEDAIGRDASFREAMASLASGSVLVSPAVAEFFGLRRGDTVFVGLDVARRPVVVPVGGTVATLPGMPQKLVDDRDSFVSAGVDYLNYLFSTRAYLVAAADDPRLARLQVLIPRVSVLAAVAPGADVRSTRDGLVGGLPARPLDARDLPTELAKTGEDMFIALALANLRVYLLGGLLLAIVGIAAVALANYLEDQRTLGLLRVRGAAPGDIVRFFVASLLAPTVLGIAIGIVVGVAGGFGFTDLIWSLRKVLSVVAVLPTHLVVPMTTAVVSAGLLLALSTVALGFSLWAFRRTPRESVGG